MVPICSLSNIIRVGVGIITIAVTLVMTQVVKPAETVDNKCNQTDAPNQTCSSSPAPCPSSSWSYWTSDMEVDQAEPVPAPQWFRCIIRTFDVSVPYQGDYVDLGEYLGASATPPDPTPDPTIPAVPAIDDPVDVIMLFQPPVLCDVQVAKCPSKKVIGCEQKLMLAHEDEYRRHCKETFVKNFEYELEKGQYDPEMASYWITHNSDFVKLGDNGKLIITYDYTTFGCPLEPYQEDGFAPDLRILTEDMNRNTTLGIKYDNSYVLIEIFGASAYNYQWTPETANCPYAPQNLKLMVEEWKKNAETLHVPHYDPKMIWDKANYIPCNETKSTRAGWKQEEYEIMNNKNADDDDVSTINRIKWTTENNRPKVLTFLAMALDDECEYYSFFGVSLPKATELDPTISLIWFVAFTMLWILLIVLGYYCRKYRIRNQYFKEARSERLKQAAWAVIYRYEKLLHESENKQLESEMTDYARKLDKKERSKRISRIRRAHIGDNVAGGSGKPPTKQNEL